MAYSQDKVDCLDGQFRFHILFIRLGFTAEII